MDLSDGRGRSPIRVLQVITSLAVGGAERLVISAAQGLSAPRFEHAICCLAEPGPLAAEAASLRVFCVGELPGLRHPLAFARLAAIIRAFRPTIVHTHLQSANLYGRVAALVAGVPITVATEHNVYAAKAERYVRVERWLARRTTALVAVSESVRQFLSEQLEVAPAAIRVIRNGVALRLPTADGVAAIAARLQTAASGARLGTTASLTPKKGHDVLLHAVAQLRSGGCACSLALAGDGPDRARLEALSRQLGIAGQVHFLGNLENPADMLAAIDVFVLPSRVEGLPLALLEAMHAGRACIATSVGGVPEVITSGENGLLVAPGDAPELVAAIGRLTQSVEQRTRLGAAARETIERGFTERAYLESLAALYEELVEEAVPRTPRIQ